MMIIPECPQGCCAPECNGNGCNNACILRPKTIGEDIDSAFPLFDKNIGIDYKAGKYIAPEKT